MNESFKHSSKQASRTASHQPSSVTTSQRHSIASSKNEGTDRGRLADTLATLRRCNAVLLYAALLFEFGFDFGFGFGFVEVTASQRHSVTATQRRSDAGRATEKIASEYFFD